MAREFDQLLITSSRHDFDEQVRKLRSSIAAMATFRPSSKQGRQVNAIIEKVRVARDRDEVVREYTKKYDGVELQAKEFGISKKDMEGARRRIEKEEPELMKSLALATDNVRKHQAEIFIGNKIAHRGIKYTPIKRVGICVPGASAPLPSTVIMTAVPAQVAGVKEIVVVSPPRYNGGIHPVILAVCSILKIDEVYRIGGAQAVAALAFGTKTVNRVNKIVGPGNQWVQTAKALVFAGGYVGIDSIVGPSEVLILANEQANPAWVAADMLSQAEHAPGSAVVFTNSQELAKNVLEAVRKQLKALRRADETRRCLKKYSKVVVFDGMEDAIVQANNLASEHLEIHCGAESGKLAERIDNAGAIFIGGYSPTALGDYWAGPSHTLPTGTTARFASPCSANDFVKSTSIIEYDKEALTRSADDIIRLAEAEGLDAHARSIGIRQTS